MDFIIQKFNLIREFDVNNIVEYNCQRFLVFVVHNRQIQERNDV